MGTITILQTTTKNPITLMGERAGVCVGADISDPTANYKRGKDCIESGHGRVMEYVNIEAVIDGYSARVIREWYTHIGCLPTRLQASTRYIDYKNLEYVIPLSVAKNPDALDDYRAVMKDIAHTIERLEWLGIPREDAAMLLPLGMTTRIVDKRNLRNVVDMSRQRECGRAYWEFQQLFRDYKSALADYSDEWQWVVKNMMHPKCFEIGYCTERKSCGRMPKLERPLE